MRCQLPTGAAPAVCYAYGTDPVLPPAFPFPPSLPRSLQARGRSRLPAPDGVRVVGPRAKRGAPAACLACLQGGMEQPLPPAPAALRSRAGARLAPALGCSAFFHLQQALCSHMLPPSHSPPALAQMDLAVQWALDQQSQGRDVFCHCTHVSRTAGPQLRAEQGLSESCLPQGGQPCTSCAAPACWAGRRLPPLLQCRRARLPHCAAHAGPRALRRHRGRHTDGHGGSRHR